MAKNLKKSGAQKRQHALGTDAELQSRLGASVRVWRHRLKLTQEALAKRAAVHRSYVADVERGARNVTLRTLATLAEALEISVGKLFAHVTATAGAAPRADAVEIVPEVREILLVEHDRKAAAATALAFKRARLANPLRIVRDGEAALDYLFGTGRSAKKPLARPQLILIVCDLPGISGEEFMQRVKADGRTSEIPLVILDVAE